MLNNPNSTVLSSFMRDNKVYVTIEIDLSNNDLIRVTQPRGGISIGGFKFDVSKNGDTYTLTLYYDNVEEAKLDVNFSSGNTCVQKDDISFDISGVTVSLKNIQICLDGSNICLKAGVYLKYAIEVHVGDIDQCIPIR